MGSMEESGRIQGAELGRIVSREIFFHLLDLEVKRARRYQNFFCVLIMKLIRHSPDDGTGRMDCYGRLARMLKDEFRESDILSCLSENCVAALLPYGDAVAGERTRSRCEANLEYLNLPLRGYGVKVEQLLFPVDGTSSSDLIQKLVHIGEA